MSSTKNVTVPKPHLDEAVVGLTSVEERVAMEGTKGTPKGDLSGLTPDAKQHLLRMIRDGKDDIMHTCMSMQTWNNEVLYARLLQRLEKTRRGGIQIWHLHEWSLQSG